MKKIFIYLMLATIFSVSCKEILFNETQKTRQLNLNDFHSVRVHGIYNLVLVQDSANTLVITGDNDINSIDAVVINDTLIVDNHKKISLNTSINQLTLHYSNLKFLVTYDPVTVSNIDTLKAEQFAYHAIGEISEVNLLLDCNYFYIASSANTLGYFYLSGRTASCALFSRYGCSIFADNLLCDYAEIYNESVGDVYINPSSYLKAFIWGPGNIYYHGTPTIEIAERKGSGRIIPID